MPTIFFSAHLVLSVVIIIIIIIITKYFSHSNVLHGAAKVCTVLLKMCWLIQTLGAEYVNQLHGLCRLVLLPRADERASLKPP